MPDLGEPFWEDVQGEPAHKLSERQRQGPVAGAVGVILVVKAHRAGVRVPGQQAAGAQRHAMRVAPDVTEHLVGSGEGTLGIDDPGFASGGDADLGVKPVLPKGQQRLAGGVEEQGVERAPVLPDQRV